MGGKRHALGALPPEERPGTRCIGAWVSPRAGLDECGKSHPPPGFDPRTVQPVASRYIERAIPVHPQTGIATIISIFEGENKACPLNY